MESNKKTNPTTRAKPYIKLDFLEHKCLFSNAKAQLSNLMDMMPCDANGRGEFSVQNPSKGENLSYRLAAHNMPFFVLTYLHI
jgi:hypothetical protein